MRHLHGLAALTTLLGFLFVVVGGFQDAPVLDIIGGVMVGYGAATLQMIRWLR